MTHADMTIYLLNEADVGHHLLANRLRILSRFRTFCVDRLADLPPPPWCRMIISVQWQQLQAAERHHLLRCLARNPAAALIITASHFSCDDTRQLLGSGRCELLNAPARPDALEDAIWRAADALIRLQHRLATCAAAEQCLEKITPRERDILRSLATGLSNKGAARQLGLSPRTVEVHRANMIRRSGVKNLTELVQMHLTLERFLPQEEWAQNTEPPDMEPPAQPCATAGPAASLPPAYPVTSTRCAARPIDKRIGSDF